MSFLTLRKEATMRLISREMIRALCLLGLWATAALSAAVVFVPSSAIAQGPSPDVLYVLVSPDQFAGGAAGPQTISAVEISSGGGLSLGVFRAKMTGRRRGGLLSRSITQSSTGLSTVSRNTRSPAVMFNSDGSKLRISKRPISPSTRTGTVPHPRP